MKKIGLVLAGGGGKGAYQIGVLQALDELQLTTHIHAISGTSVGGLNGALLLSGDMAAAKHAWETIAPSKILSIQSEPLIEKLTNRMKPLEKLLRGYSQQLESYGVFSRSGMEELIQTYVNMPMLARSSVSLYVTCVEVPSLRKNVFLLNGLPAEKVTRLLLATSAIPVVFPPEEIDGRLYVDGGLADNVPIEPLYTAGCDTIIVVPLNRAYTFDRSLYPNANIYEIVPQQSLGNIITGTMQFNAAAAKTRMQHGYDDAMRILQPVLAMNRHRITIEHAASSIVARDRQFQQVHTHNATQFQNDICALQAKIKGGRLQ